MNSVTTLQEEPLAFNWGGRLRAVRATTTVLAMLAAPASALGGGVSHTAVGRIKSPEPWEVHARRRAVLDTSSASIKSPFQADPDAGHQDAGALRDEGAQFANLGVDEVLFEIRSFSGLSDNWDGEGAIAPSKAVCDDAFAVISAWDPTLGVPIAEPDHEGNISVNAFDKAGNLTIAMDFIGGSEAVFAVFVGLEVVDRGRIDSREQTQIIDMFSRMTSGQFR